MNKEQDSLTNDETAPAINSAIEGIMDLIIQERWNEARTKQKQELATYPNNEGLFYLLLFINSNNNLIDDRTYQNAQTNVSSEWRPRFDEIRNRALSRHYLKKALEDYLFSNEDELCHAPTPLRENENFSKSFDYASENRRKQMIAIQHTQAEEFLKQCIKEKGISGETDLQTISSPLAEDRLFQMALKYVSNERQKELQKIQQNQVEYFLHMCMITNNVDREADLQYANDFLPLDKDFQKAMKYASPERQKQLQRIQFKQAENKLKDYLNTNRYLLAFKKESLETDGTFQDLLQHSSPELQNELKKLQLQQKENSISEKEEFQLYANAINKNPAAMYEISNCYRYGEGTDKNMKKALDWLRKAAENGYSEAMYQLGMLYYKGKEIEQDLVVSFGWFYKAATNNHAKAMYQLALCYKNGEGTSQKTKDAHNWFCKGAENGDPESMFQLGMSYYESKDYKKAFEWFSKAADCNHTEAIYQLFKCYHNGIGVKKDKVKAWEWLQKAAEQGHPEATIKLEETKKIIEYRTQPW